MSYFCPLFYRDKHFQFSTMFHTIKVKCYMLSNHNLLNIINMNFSSRSYCRNNLLQTKHLSNITHLITAKVDSLATEEKNQFQNNLVGYQCSTKNVCIININGTKNMPLQWEKVYKLKYSIKFCNIVINQNIYFLVYLTQLLFLTNGKTFSSEFNSPGIITYLGDNNF